MDGWCSVEELTRWGFAHAPVVMANEAHSGLRRCVRTRQVGVRMVRAAFVIDQDVTVDFGHGHRDWVSELLDSLSDVLAAHGGTAGILRDQAPESLAGWPADAVIVSTDNALS
jgi:hypothetical protein